MTGSQSLESHEFILHALEPQDQELVPSSSSSSDSSDDSALMSMDSSSESEDSEDNVEMLQQQWIAFLKQANECRTLEIEAEKKKLQLREKHLKLLEEKLALKREQMEFEKLKFEHKKLWGKKKEEHMRKLIELEEKRLKAVMNVRNAE